LLDKYISMLCTCSALASFFVCFFITNIFVSANVPDLITVPAGMFVPATSASVSVKFGRGAIPSLLPRADLAALKFHAPPISESENSLASSISQPESDTLFAP